MNYLAHAFLSFDDPEILVGNMISDFVKGRKKFDLPEGIQRGIALHRQIDQFTDDHPVNKQAQQYFRPAYRLYAGAFVDVLYDHFLAGDALQFPSHASLRAFTKKVYSTLNLYFDVLPQRFQQMLPFMEKQDWLYNYHSEQGLQRSLEGLRRRAVYIHESATAFELIRQHRNILHQHYQEFFPELKNFSQQYWRNLLDS